MSEKIEVSNGSVSVEIRETEDGEGLLLRCFAGMWCDLGWPSGVVEMYHDFNEAINEASIHVHRHVDSIVTHGQ